MPRVRVRACPQTSHIIPEQAGPILQRLQPRLAVLHHLIVNDVTRDAIVTAVRANYPKVSTPCAPPALLTSPWLMRDWPPG